MPPSVSLGFGFVIGFVHAQSPTNVDEQKLITLEQRAEKAFNTKDAQELAFIEQHTGDWVTNVDVFGRTTHESRAKTMEEMGHQDPGVERKVKLSDFHAHIYADTAVVSYRMLFSASGNKNPTECHRRPQFLSRHVHQRQWRMALGRRGMRIHNADTAACVRRDKAHAATAIERFQFFSYVPALTCYVNEHASSNCRRFYSPKGPFTFEESSTGGRKSRNPTTR